MNVICYYFLNKIQGDKQMSFDGYVQIIFSTVIPAFIAIAIEALFSNRLNKKKYVICTIGIWVLVAIIVSVIYILPIWNNNYIEDKSKYVLDDSEVKIGDQSPVFTGDGDNKVIYNNYYTDTISKSALSPENEILENESTIQLNFGLAMQDIYNNEKIIKEEIINNKENKPVYSSIYPGVSYWHILSKVRLIEVATGFRNLQCSRIYYFDENENLTFALIDDDKGEHRLYFYKDILIRYIDTNGEEHDINYGLENFECEWTKLALEESYEIFNGVKKPSESDDFSVVASYDMDTVQSSIKGIDVLIKADTSFPADHVTISAISDIGEQYKPCDMHGGTYEWYFRANFYIKGTYAVTVTAYTADGQSVSDTFEYIY